MCYFLLLLYYYYITTTRRQTQLIKLRFNRERADGGQLVTHNERRRGSWRKARPRFLKFGKMDTLLPLVPSSLIVAVVFYPIDVLRALKMSSAGGQGVTPQQFYAKYGIRGFFGQGMAPEVTRATVMRVSKFFFNPIMSDALWGKAPKDCTIPQKMVSGALATFPEILAISPFEVAKLGLQVDTANTHKNNMMNFMKHMYKTRGISGLYCGWFGMQCRQSIFTGIFFGTVGTFRQKFRDNGFHPTVATLGGGVLAGCLGALGGNIPSDVVRSVVQKKAFSDPSRPTHGISPAGVLEHLTVAKRLLPRMAYGGCTRAGLLKQGTLGLGCPYPRY